MAHSFHLMRCLRPVLLAIILGCLMRAFPCVAQEPEEKPALTWPAVTQSARPWTRWWWHGSAVDEANLTRLLKEYHSAGLGGVEITCIYGVKGNQERNLEYLSPAWLEVVQHSVREANRLGMGVDLPAGSGWRMGGPSVKKEDANLKLELEKSTLKGGEAFEQKFAVAPQAVVAVSDQGEQITLTDKISQGSLRWEAPEDSTWTVYTLRSVWAGDRVKRPAPGGAGLNINPYFRRSVMNYLDVFGEKLDQLPGLRAQFHDSFEYEGNWQPNFLDEFAHRRGYRLEDHLPALAGEGPQELVARVKCDYRETLSDLVLEEFVQPWAKWAHQHNCLARNQGHGSPGNWLDLYAACDIPETESFGRLQGGDADRSILKFASSAANVAGRKLVSSETGTWLEEHFHVTLAHLKQIVDRQFFAGVNHTIYHGTAYSPADAQWPGWLFYASSQLNPQNPIWRDFPELNAYVTRCQSILQASQPDNDVLLYWPLHDAWQNPRGMRMEIRVHNAHDWFYDHPLGDAAELLEDNGYAFDYVSDRGLATCEVDESGQITAPGGQYQTIVIPRAQNLPLETLIKLNALSSAGANVLFWGGLPKSEPGLKGAKPSEAWDKVIAQAKQLIAEKRAWQGDDFLELLAQQKIRNEASLCERGLEVLRKQWDGKAVYFLRNKQETPLDAWLSLSAEVQGAAIFDPSTGSIGRATTREGKSGQLEVRLQIAPGQTIFLVASEAVAELQPWAYLETTAPATPLTGPWELEFLSGGPTLAKSFTSPKPVSWTEATDPEAQRFAGTVSYTTELQVPDNKVHYLLSLGEVRESARVKLNGQHVATLISKPYAVVLENLQAGNNQLDIEVTGLAANRIRDLDRRGIEWRIFEDINFVTIKYRPFDASKWPVRPMGLLGPVTIAPLATGE